MSAALDEFFAGVEDEFRLEITDDDRDFLNTPGEVIDFIAEQTMPRDGMDMEEHREHIASVLGEIMAQTLGITRYHEESRFIEDLRVS
jgi:hypothetical protein